MSAVQTAFAPSPELATAVLGESGTDVNLCFQCGKCAAGCPVAYAMDFTPTQLIHAIQLGIDDVVLHSKSMWLCAPSRVGRWPSTQKPGRRSR